jgi:protein-S-isoprenylcysteine O-methyltransferase Ste14
LEITRVIDAALALLFVILYWGLVVANVVNIKGDTGKAPRIFPKTKEEKPLQLGWRVVVLGLLAQPLILLAIREPWPFFRPIELIDHAALFVLGSVLVVVGILGTRRCYAVMGRHWNMWIDPQQESPLIDAGPFRRVRHPIYAFQMLVSTGIWCLLPTPFLMVIVLVNGVCIWMKASNEERYLTHRHGDAYRDYLSRTGRFFPKL